MTTRKVVTLALLVLFALAAPVCHKLIVTLEEPVLRVDGGKPPPPIPPIPIPNTVAV